MPGIIFDLIFVWESNLKKHMYALKNKHRQVSLQKFLSKNRLKESERRNGNYQSDGDVHFISTGFPSMSITEDNYNYRMVAQTYLNHLN